MKHTRSWLWMLLVVALVAFFTACTDSTDYGECVGIDDNAKRDSTLVYEIDTGNVIVGILLAETLIVPVLVVLDGTYCPTGRKP